MSFIVQNACNIGKPTSNPTKGEALMNGFVYPFNHIQNFLG
jgi:hypothetical protein